MTKLFGKYADTIRHELQTGKRRGSLEKSIQDNPSNFTGQIQERFLYSDNTMDESLFNSLNPLSGLLGKKVKYHERPGAHPDFCTIKQQNTFEYHYISSMFIDISRSTGLFKKYMPLTVANITTTIQRVAIHTSWYFDAFIQRFHGDGLMIYFGGKNISLQQSVGNALNAASYFTYFVKNDLKNLFLEQGVEDIYTRIGIDVGNTEDVLWYLAGMGDCSEITTCSLHTSLAAHMQSNAQRNGIMVGDNIKINSLLSPDLYSIKKHSDGIEDRYIFRIPEEDFNYTQWQFNWEQYLRHHAPIRLDEINSLNLAVGAPAILKPEKNMDYLKKQVADYKPYNA